MPEMNTVMSQCEQCHVTSWTQKQSWKNNAKGHWKRIKERIIELEDIGSADTKHCQTKIKAEKRG